MVSIPSSVFLLLHAGSSAGRQRIDKRCNKQGFISLLIPAKWEILFKKKKGTDLSAGSRRPNHLSSCPQRHHDNGGEGHSHSQCVRPVGVNVRVVHFDMLVVDHVEEYRNLWERRYANMSDGDCNNIFWWVPCPSTCQHGKAKIGSAAVKTLQDVNRAGVDN